MARPIVILHGWSDNAASFKPLAKKLREATGQQTLHISLGDWVSLDDDVTYPDLADAMERAWSSHPKLKNLGKGGADCIVHSTGALVVREWMRTHREDVNPIKHLVMLAPANFGSPLAHHGRAVLGRARNGFRQLKNRNTDRIFETGTEILRGLELASSYTTDLALRDLFGARGKRFGPGGVLCSVIVGNEGNQALGLLEFDGSDGTVRTSTASLRCRRMDADFPLANEKGISAAEKKARQNVKPKTTNCSAKTAFLLVDGLDHGDVTLKKPHGSRPGKLAQKMVLERILEALQVGDNAFEAMIDTWDEQTSSVQHGLDERERAAATDFNPFTLTDDEKHAHHNFLLALSDHHGAPVDDFVLEIYNKPEIDDKDGRAGKDSLTRRMNKKVIDDVHEFRTDRSRRCFHLDLFEFDASAREHPNAELSISVSAQPNVGDRKHRVGYRTYEDDEIGAIRMRLGDQLKGTPIFAHHATTLAFFTIQRCQDPEVFELKNA